MKYIDAEKLKVEIERRRLSNRYIDTEGYESELLDIIDSLQQEQPERICTRCRHFNKKEDCCDCPYGGMKYLINENGVYECNCFDEVEQEQPEVDIEKEIENEWKKCHPTDEGMGLESANIVNEQFDAIARHFYELGASVMRKRIINPEFNQKVIEKMKYECPVDEFNARKEE